MTDQPQEIRDRFARNLRRARKRSGLSQEDVGRLAEMHRTAISSLEAGRREPRMDTLIKLSAVLEVEIDAFFDGIRWHGLELPRPGRFQVTSVK